MKLGLEGKLALVTGGSGGIGAATARLLLEEGARVALTDLKEDGVTAAAKDLKALGEIQTFAADLTDSADTARLYKDVTAAMGEPDILVSAAGITGAQGDFLEIDDDGWHHTMETNLMSAVRISRAAIPAMRRKGWGRVILVSSEDAEQPYVEELPYCASKAAITTLAKGLSKAYGPDNVLVNTVAPAFIASPMTDAMMRNRAEERGESFEEAIESFLKENRPGMALNRRGEAEEVAAVIVFLCSQQASFVNGANYRVDSGAVLTV
ncbi:SDR family NAD(P)-dependent oxidoreductase [Falsirhodobacter algicola]|uniref:SDR family oxidoreductase n=1 Tax=Falsirhodobacter algicola TaxID=2692330 RepID=A0A8J8MRK0_9RHOB|nr:SDR family oxidoreductase [Falsirhodobacter algicola]QUS34908.1 SDR family oxidoreductase [Falsirhodobacter algicola]